jgi:hypothetical protein
VVELGEWMEMRLALALAVRAEEEGGRHCERVGSLRLALNFLFIYIYIFTTFRKIHFSHYFAKLYLYTVTP